MWLRDSALEDSENLPEPEVLAAEIVEDLEAALEAFRGVAEELDVGGHTSSRILQRGSDLAVLRLREGRAVRVDVQEGETEV